MGTLKLKYKRVSVTKEYGKPSWLNTLTPEEFKQFNVALLGLGKVKKQASVTNALAAVFDLEGFTDFCSQIDPQLVVPEFLSDFLGWLFESIKTKFTEKQTEEVVRIWGSLPFFGKFNGDGVLFLWDTDLGGLIGIGNIAFNLKMVCEEYSSELQPRLAESLARAPKSLRVGIARGQVLSIGDGRDFVGPCINMAARLQKLGSLSFVVSRRGFDPKECFGKTFEKQLVLKKLPIRGVGEDEPVLLLKREFAALSDEEKAQFS